MTAITADLQDLEFTGKTLKGLITHRFYFTIQ